MSLTVVIKHFTVEFSIIHVFHNCFYEPCMIFILVPAVFLSFPVLTLDRFVRRG